MRASLNTPVAIGFVVGQLLYEKFRYYAAAAQNDSNLLTFIIIKGVLRDCFMMPKSFMIPLQLQHLIIVQTAHQCVSAKTRECKVLNIPCALKDGQAFFRTDRLLIDDILS